MEGFSIKGEPGLIKITFKKVFGFPDQTSPFGGYDVEAGIEIISGGFQVNSTFWLTTGELYELHQELKVCNEKLTGVVKYKSYEGDLEFTAIYDNLGHIGISGNYYEGFDNSNMLKFEFSTDQTFIANSIKELQVINDKYGNMEGKKGL